MMASDRRVTYVRPCAVCCVRWCALVLVLLAAGIARWCSTLRGRRVRVRVVSRYSSLSCLASARTRAGYKVAARTARMR
jgi:hypothetical protein